MYWDNGTIWIIGTQKSMLYLHKFHCLELFSARVCTVEKYTKYNSKKRIKRSLGEGGPSKEAISTTAD